MMATTTTTALTTTSSTRSKMRELHLSSYMPATDKKFLHLMQTCSALRHLYMRAYVSDPWPAPRITESGLKKFIQFILGIQRVEICTEDSYNEKLKVEALLSEYSHHSTKENWNMDLKIGFYG